jgi:hypothetical protein
MKRELSNKWYKYKLLLFQIILFVLLY